MRIFTSPLLWAILLFVRVSAFGQTTNTNVVVVAAPATNVVPILRLSDQTRADLTFGLDRVSSLQFTILGFEAWQYLASLIYIFMAFAIARALDYVICVQLKKWAEKTSTTLDDILIEIAHTPIKIVSFVIFLHIGLQVFRWPSWVEVWITRALHLVVAGSLTYMLVKLVDILVGHWRKRASNREDKDKAFNDQLFPVISKTLKFFIVVVAVLVTSQNLGLNITGVLASLSIGGLALGLAAQDTVANLFGAVAVFADKPFQIGDTVKLEQIEGVVESIGLRSTRIRNPDGHLITVPNKTMGNATIINITRRPGIRTVMDIGLTYNMPTEKVRRAVEILKEIYGGHAQTADLVVSFNQFAASALNIRLIHIWKGSDYKAYMANLQELNLAVHQRFETEKIFFAYPTQTILLKQDSPWNLSLPAEEMPKQLNSAPPT